MGEQVARTADEERKSIVDYLETLSNRFRFQDREIPNRRPLGRLLGEALDDVAREIKDGEHTKDGGARTPNHYSQLVADGVATARRDWRRNND